MKNSNTNKIGSAQRFTHWAAVLTLAASLVIMGLFTACPNAAGGGGTSSDGNTGGGGGTPQSKCTVNFSVEDGNGFLIAKVGDTIIDSGAQVEKDTTVTFTAIEKTGYRVYGWTLNGTVVNDTAKTYSLTIDKDVTVKVSFEDAGSPPKPRYNVYFQEFGKGSISAQVDGNTITPDTKVQEDKTVLFTATADPGYKVQKWTLNGTPVNGTAETYSLILTNSVSVCVYFERNAPKYPVNFSVDGGNGTLKASFAGFVQLDTGDTIYEGDEVRFTAVPAEGYEVGIWTIEGGSFESGSGIPGYSYARVKVTAPVTVKVRFIKESIPLSKLDIEGTVLKGYTGEKPRGILRVPAGITEIAERAFKNCTDITEVYLPESLTEIGTYAFYNCYGITKLILSKNLAHIEYCAFYSCKMTGTVKFPASLSFVGESAFKSCNKVEYFDFSLCKNPPLTAIGTDAFNYTDGRFKVKTGTGIKALLTASGVDASRIDEEP
ncbi:MULTISPECIES: leucine-rich repeat protein [unclassified Treponema]|uniref:leucine-rich repeat protein n=1 Tax=unclassified Treponema TaxID=2638727 RepID=UPI0020A2F9F7|nr:MULTISPECIES: leucine-rich repeat protein [unclassified Treponema]UTC66417.1 leucine-rich repeat domain-containing protein [Treponema sp. OMZ 789]UTC69148.1 leucine-rich repeat domain-containing protein [Treponema sp. OMZ 790]UTC71860.1 leucine-rich repeat domain-containing protein [Treponema sp. OMZ 791]